MIEVDLDKSDFFRFFFFFFLTKSFSEKSRLGKVLSQKKSSSKVVSVQVFSHQVCGKGGLGPGLAYTVPGQTTVRYQLLRKGPGISLYGS